MTRFRLGSNQPCALGQEVGAGGEATIFLVQERPGSVAKIYHQPTPERAAKLNLMVSYPPTDPTIGLGHTSIVWPQELVYNEYNRCAGFLMPLVNYDTSVQLFKLYNPLDRLTRAPGFTWAYLLNTAANLASAVGAVHAVGDVIGDLNESNVLVTNQALVTLIDCDSIQVRDPGDPGRVFRCVVGKPEYTAPELQGVDFSAVDRSPEHDRFALAVLIFMLLMEGVHPFQGVWKGKGDSPSVAQEISQGRWPYAAQHRSLLFPPKFGLPFVFLPPEIQALFKRSFVAGCQDPSARPLPEEWRQTLVRAENNLRICRSNSQHRYSDHLGDNCPWCARMRRLGMDVFPQPGQQAIQQSLRPAARQQPVQQQQALRTAAFAPTRPRRGGGTKGPPGWIPGGKAQRPQRATATPGNAPRPQGAASGFPIPARTPAQGPGYGIGWRAMPWSIVLLAILMLFMWIANIRDNSTGTNTGSSGSNSAATSAPSSGDDSEFLKTVTAPDSWGYAATQTALAEPTPLATQTVLAVLAGDKPLPTGYVAVPDTSHTVTAFADLYKQFGGISGMGYPVTEMFVEQSEVNGRLYWVQYFEKAVAEYHRESPGANAYQLSLLGTWQYYRKYANGEPPPKALLGSASRVFTVTGNTVQDPFLTHWEKNGGLARFGWPISEAFEEKSDVDGKTYIVQYFQRAEMEYHPELGAGQDVALTPLGTLRLKELYGSNPPGQ